MKGNQDVMRFRAKVARQLKWYVTHPVPGFIVILRWVSGELKRRLVTGPVLKSYCKEYGRGVRTGGFVPFVIGSGDLILGDHVVFHGRLDVAFSRTYSWRPRLEIGDGSRIGHDGLFTVGRLVKLGRMCRLGTGVIIADTSGHPTDPIARAAGEPSPAERVRPVVIGDNVWIGMRSIILPGTVIGDAAVVSAGSVVRGVVEPYTIVAGNPAVKVADIPRGQSPETLPELMAMEEEAETPFGASATWKPLKNLTAQSR